MKQIITVPSCGMKAMASRIVYKVIPTWYGFSRGELTMTVMYMNTREIRPTLVWVSGGAWQQVDSCALLAEQTYLLEQGYNLAAINYRNSTAAPFPAQIEDIKEGIRYLRAHAEEFGVDKKRIAIMGESAGGHLATMVAVTSDSHLFDVGENLTESSAVQCAIDWYGPSDFLTMGSKEDLPYEVSLLYGIDAIRSDDLEKLAKTISPLYYVNNHTPPMMILHGDADMLVNIDQSERLHQALNSAGVENEFYVLKGAGHGDAMFGSKEVHMLIGAFLDKHLKNK